MVPGVSQDSNRTASGCTRRFVFVRLSYTCKALLKTDWLEDAVATTRAGGDMMGGRGWVLRDDKGTGDCGAGYL